jgi:hypothetical protein
MVGEFQLPWGSLAAGGMISILPAMAGGDHNPVLVSVFA